MAEIRVMEPHLAGLIAAGEVVERPASVAKELTENAIDAGAAHIEVEITSGGLGMIEVRDDGCGIEKQWLPNAFVRHATSKIAAESDLEAIGTLGFRGEALASVADVARVSLVSCAQGSAEAWRYAVEGGQPQGLWQDARPRGTTVTVRELFYNTPARMKFLKKDASEAACVQDVVEHLALSHPEISFRYLRDGREQFFTPGDGRLESAVRALYPREFARALLGVQHAEGGMQVSGLITPPAAARASRSMQSFYVNGRYVKSRTMMAAAENAYRGMLMGGRFPGCVLMLRLPAGAVDVNVHPAKTEVRFAREGDVFNAVYRAVRAALMAPGALEVPLALEKPPARGRQAAQGVQIGFTTLPQQPQPEEEQPQEQQPEQPQAPTQMQEPQPGPAQTQQSSQQPQPEQEQPQELQRPQTPRQPAARRAAPEAPLYPAWEEPAAQPLVADSLAAAPPRWQEPARRGFARNPFAGLDIAVEAAQGADAPAADENAPAVQGENAPAQDADGLQKSAPAASAADENTSAVQGENAPASTENTPAPAERPSASAGEPLQVVGEVFHTYIVAQRGDELCLIDKHAAHERLLYERLVADYGHVAGQLLLEPVTVELSAQEKTALLEQQSYLEDIGISLDDFGGGTVLVREVPADVRADSVQDMVQEIAARLAAGQRQPLAGRTAWVLHSVACRAAVKGGDASRLPELVRLAQDILDGSVLPFCPHGRPVVLRVKRKELERQFGRLG